MLSTTPMTVVETGRFLKDTRLMSDGERSELVAFLGSSPEAGDLIPTGGVRKIRWGLPGRGKRGGARVIYYYHSHKIPLFLLAAYSKSEKGNLTKSECHELKKLVLVLASSYLGRK